MDPAAEAAAPPLVEEGVNENEEEEDASESSTPEDENDGAETANLLTMILSRDDPRRMRLTENEWRWAMDIKDAIEADAELDNLSDFMYAQMAIICKADLEGALTRAQGLQDFKQEYYVKDTYEDGCLRLRQMFELCPRQHLDFSFSAQDGTYVFCHDSTKLDSTRFNTSAKLNAFMAATYYTHTTWCPDMDSIRKGTICIAECSEWSWTKKQDFKVFQKMFSEFMAVYPFTGICHCYNGGMIWNMMAAMLRKFLPPEIRDTLKLGYKSDVRLDQQFLVPDVETANLRMFNNMAATLKRRYEHEKSFSLLQDFPTYQQRRDNESS